MCKNRWLFVGAILFLCHSAIADEALRLKRMEFQTQELMPAKKMGWIFNPGDPPRIIWRDADGMKVLGAQTDFRVRWFDADLKESAKPSHGGKWAAVIEGKSPNGTTFRRGLTFFCRTPGFFIYVPDHEQRAIANPVGILPREVWDEHHDEFTQMMRDTEIAEMNDSAAGAIVIANLIGEKAKGRPVLPTETAAAINEQFQLDVREKLLGSHTQHLAAAKQLSVPAMILHEGTLSQAGMKPAAKEKIDAVCDEWAKEGKEPCVTLVARHGVIVTHHASGGVGLDYRNDVMSITKTVTATLFARFVDQKLVDFDDSVAKVLPEFRADDPHVPTFRQCFTHMSGMVGHGEFGGCRNVYFDNIVLNGIDANEPGKVYNYSGMGYDLAATAMELMTGKETQQLYAENLFAPLGIGQVPMGGGAAGAQLTAREIAILAQTLLNRGSYGNVQLFSPQTFQRMLPEPLSKRYKNVKDIEGFGNHFMHPCDGFSANTIGHGSFSGCILVIDRDHDLIIAQSRRGLGEKYGDLSTKLFKTIIEQLDQ